MKFHHIGYLTKNISKTFNNFKKIDYKKKGNLFNDKILMVNIQFIQNGRNLIELVKPFKNNKGILEYLRRKNYAYHFAYKVINLENSIKKLKKNGYKVIVNPVPAKAFNNKKIAFLKMKDDFIIELIES